MTVAQHDCGAAAVPHFRTRHRYRQSGAALVDRSHSDVQVYKVDDDATIKSKGFESMHTNYCAPWLARQRLGVRLINGENAALIPE